MACKRSLNGDFRCFPLSNLADHDDVRILSQHVLEHFSERQPDPFSNFILIDDIYLILNRVLDRDDILLDGVEVVQRRIETRRLTASRGPRYQNEPEPLAELPFVGGQVLHGHAELLDIEYRLILIEHAQDDLLAMQARQGAESQVHISSLRNHLNSAILG